MVCGTQQGLYLTISYGLINRSIDVKGEVGLFTWSTQKTIAVVGFALTVEIQVYESSTSAEENLKCYVPQEAGDKVVTPRGELALTRQRILEVSFSCPVVEFFF